LQHDWETARKTMWNYVGIQRDLVRLEVAQRRMDEMAADAEHSYRAQRPSIDLLELRNVTLLGSLVVRCASFRKESRGLHALAQFPDRNDAKFSGDTHLRSGEEAHLSPLREKDDATRNRV